MAALFLVLLVQGCDRNTGAAQVPKMEVFVLVDLSATWHNSVSDARNETLLGEIGSGIALSAESSEPPIAIQYRVIGTESLGREPICDALYQPTVVTVKGRRPDYLVTKISKLKGYLGIDCPAVIVRQAPEKLTQISAAIDSVASGEKPAGTARYMIITSDFLEETGGAPAQLQDLTGLQILLVYRPVAEDHGDPTRLGERLKAWTNKLGARHAQVKAVPDVALKRAEITRFLNGP
jgi:hypothetical protein